MPNGKKRKTLQEILAELRGITEPRGRGFLGGVVKKFAGDDDRLIASDWTRDWYARKEQRERETPFPYPFLEEAILRPPERYPDVSAKVTATTPYIIPKPKEERAPEVYYDPITSEWTRQKPLPGVLGEVAETIRYGAEVPLFEVAGVPISASDIAGIGAITFMGYLGVKSLIPVTKEIVNKTLQKALNTGLDRWIAQRSRGVPPQHLKKVQDFLYSRLAGDRVWLQERATSNMVRRQAEARAARQPVAKATQQAVSDTIRDVENRIASLVPRATQTGAMAMGGKPPKIPKVPAVPAKPIIGQPQLVAGQKLPELPIGKTEVGFIQTEIPGGIMLTPIDIRASQSTKLRTQILKNIEEKFYDAVKDSPIDIAATTYLKEGDFEKFIKEMPEFAQLTPEEIEAVKIALRATKGGKIVPAMRKSGFYVTDEFARYLEHRDVHPVSGLWQDPTRMMQNIDGGFFGGATQKYVLWPTQRTTLAKLRFSDEAKAYYRALLEKYDMVGKPATRRLAGDVIQHISRNEVTASIAELLKKPDIKKFVGRHSPAIQERVIKFAQETRKAFDDLIDKQNLARLKRNQDPIAYRDNYRPWVIDTNLFSRLLGLRQTPKDFMARPQLPDYIKPTQPFNPRAEAREGGLYGYLKERDLQKLVYDYIDTAAKDIFNTNIVHNAKIHAQVLRAKGLDRSATLIEEWAAEAYAGITPGISRGVRRFLPMQAIRPGLWLRRRLTSAVFPLNWTWNLFVQTSSGALTIMRYGVVNTINGLDALLTPSGWKYTKEAYSVIIKGRRGGKVAYQDIGASIEKTMALQGAPIEKFEHWLNFLTNTIEGALTRISVRAAYWDGISKGLKGRELLQYASEGGSKTQSMYNLEDLPGVLRAKEVGALVPFQTFAFEVFNSVRELNLIGIGKAGAYESISAKSAKGKATISKRLQMLARWIAAITAVNLIVDKAINRKPWNASSFIPFWAVMMGGINAGNPWNMVLPYRYSQEAWGAITSFLKYGNWNKLRKWAVRYHIPAGVQLSRMMDGLEAVIEGRVTDVRGRTLFRVPPDEWFRAIFMGPYQTEQGREYIDKMGEAKGPLWEMLNIPLPKMQGEQAPGVPTRPVTPRKTKTLEELLRE